ncbi:MAG: hypothetical protein LKJ90_07540 [Faecalibacterium sp.]|jgi:hypothetical protein|nr:hypothetical protein [Faecalibacterium sp.]
MTAWQKKTPENRRSCGVALVLALKACLFFSTGVATGADTASYAEIDGFAIFGGRLDAVRTPGYPFVVEIFQRLFGQGYAGPLTFFQLVVSAVSLCLFYRALRQMGLNETLSFLTFAGSALTISVYGWDRYVLSESLTLSLTFMMIFLLVRFLHTASLRDALWLAADVFAATALRPQSAIFAAILLGFFAVFCLYKKAGIAKLLLSCGCMAVLLAGVYAYALRYESQYGYFGMSTTLPHQQTANLIADGLYARLPDDTYAEQVEFIRTALDETQDSSLSIGMQLCATYGYETASAYDKAVIRNNLPAYVSARLYALVTSIPEAFASYPPAQTQMPQAILNVVRLLLGVLLLPITFGCGYPACAIAAVLFIRQCAARKPFDFMDFGIVVILAAIYVSVVFSTCGAYPRTALQALPFLILAFARGADALIRKVRGDTPPAQGGEETAR